MVLLAVLSYIVFVCTTRRRVGDGERKGLLESARERAQAKLAQRNREANGHDEGGQAARLGTDLSPGTGAAPTRPNGGATDSFVAIYDDESDDAGSESDANASARAPSEGYQAPRV